MRRGTVPLIVIAATALVALLVYGLIAVGTSKTIDDAVARGDAPRVPERTLPRLGGGAGSLEDYRGRPIVVNFWASWCEPCKAEAPVLRDAQRQLEAVGGTVVGVTVDDATDDSLRFMEDERLDFPSLRDVDGDLADDFGNTGVPETFVVDREGRIVALRRGQIDARWLEQHLGKVLR